MIEKLDFKITHQYELAKHSIQLQDQMLHSMLYGNVRRRTLFFMILLGIALYYTVNLINQYLVYELELF